MIKNVYAVYDTCAGIYMGPLLHNTDAEAKREFIDQVASDDPRNKIANHPEHFSLFRVGRWDDSKGEIVPEDRFVLMTALEAKVPEVDIVPIREADSNEDAHGFVDREDIVT